MDVQYITDLPIDTMVQFEHGPIMRSGLTRANATIQFTGEKKVTATRRNIKKKTGPLRQFGVLLS